MIYLILGIIIGFFCGVMTGIVVMHFISAAKTNDKIIKEYKKEKDNEKLFKN